MGFKAQVASRLWNLRACEEFVLSALKQDQATSAVSLMIAPCLQPFRESKQLWLLGPMFYELMVEKLLVFV